jgi:hypothetical protein
MKRIAPTRAKVDDNRPLASELHLIGADRLALCYG